MEKNLRAFLAELIGTFAVVFLAAAAVCGIQAGLQSGAVVPSPAAGSAWKEFLQPGLLAIALVYGLVYAVALAVTLNFSEGFLNPAITLMLWVYKRLDGWKTLVFLAVQVLGAVLAGGLIRLVFPTTILVNTEMGTPHINYRAFGMGDPSEMVGLNVIPGIALEFGLTFVLTFVIFGTLIDPRARRPLADAADRRLATLWVGLALLVITVAGFWVTGAAVNPARWVGTVIWEKTISALQTTNPFRDHVVYWFGPIVGALAAGGLYTTLLLPKEGEGATATAAAGAKVPTGAGATLFRARR
jgi:glycerol uptake facilitator-like aquaporin